MQHVIQLLESSHPRQHHEGGALASILIHGTILTLAVQISATQVVQELRAARAERIQYAMIDRKAEAPVKAAKPLLVKAAEGGGGAPVVALPARGFQVLMAPVAIPNALPEIDLSKAVTNEADFSGRGVAGGVARGVVGGVVLKPDQDKPLAPVGREAATYIITEVEKAAMLADANVVPKYPESLRAANIEGEVRVHYVVDTTGVADMSTLQIVNSTHPLFTDAVKLAIRNMRFYPAEIGNRKVRMLVEQPFMFSLEMAP